MTITDQMPSTNDDMPELIPITATSKCVYCEHIFDTNKLVWHSTISQYICIECHHLSIERRRQRRQRRLERIQRQHV